MDSGNQLETPEVTIRKPIGSNEGDFETVLVDGFLGLGLSLGCSLILLFFAVQGADEPVEALAALMVGVVLAAVTLLLGRLINDWLNSEKGGFATKVVYLAALAIAASSYCFDAFALSSACSCVALVATVFLYGKYLGSLDRKILMLLISAVFVFAGFTILMISSLDAWFCYAIVWGLVFLTAMITVLFCRKDMQYNSFGDAAESKSRSIKVKGNNHTLLMLGFMCGGCVFVPAMTDNGDLAVLTIAGAMGLAGVLSLLLGQVDERLYKETLLKDCAFVTAVCFLPLTLLEGNACLVPLAIFLIWVFLNIIVLVNAIVETTRFNLINPIWLLGYEGFVFFVGLLAGCVLAMAGGALALEYAWALDATVIVVVVLCAYMQISVNYQAYPFEPVIESTPEEKAISQEITERNGQRKTLYQKKRQYACELYSLSPREREILATLLKGRDAKYIMDTFYISQSTAKTHIYNIYRKFDVHSRQELLDFIEDIELPPEELEDVLPDEEDVI